VPVELFAECPVDRKDAVCVRRRDLRPPPPHQKIGQEEELSTSALWYLEYFGAVVDCNHRAVGRMLAKCSLEAEQIIGSQECYLYVGAYNSSQLATLDTIERERERERVSRVVRSRNQSMNEHVSYRKM